MTTGLSAENYQRKKGYVKHSGQFHRNTFYRERCSWPGLDRDEKVFKTHSKTFGVQFLLTNLDSDEGE